MKVLRADAMGFCFGVRDAVQLASQIDDPGQVTILGELVHNPTVLNELTERGFSIQSESDRNAIPSRDRVLVTAHGISDRRREQLQSDGKLLIDTTCPLVERVHSAAQRFHRLGAHVVVIGRPGHVEVQGIVEDLDSFSIFPDVDAVRPLAHDLIGVVCQTTMPPDLAAEIHAAIQSRNPRADVRFANTVCQPTIDRQTALERLFGQVDALVVVGGHNSNNTRRLVDRARSRNVPAVHVESAAGIDPDWFADFAVVGLTAGTSTPDSVIESVHQALCQLKPEGANSCKRTH